MVAGGRADMCHVEQMLYARICNKTVADRRDALNLRAPEHGKRRIFHLLLLQRVVGALP